PLPPQVRATVESVLGGSAIQEEFAWMSWAGTVWRLTGQAGGTMFVKRAAELAGERDRLAWLAGRWPVPKVAGFFHEFGDDWLVTYAVPGVPMHHTSLGWDPDRVAKPLGEILRGLHSTGGAGCPVGVRDGGDRPVGPELLAFCLQGARRDHLALAMRQRPALAHAVVVDRPHIEPPKLKHQEHLRRPPADPTDLDEAGDQLVVRQRVDVAQR